MSDDFNSGSVNPMCDTKWSQSVIKVGGGRGFVMTDDHDDLVVVTAAHCLPHLPPAHTASYTGERTYERVVGPLGHEPSISAEVLFVDSISDVAILGAPDDLQSPEQAEAYYDLVECLAPMPMNKLDFRRQSLLLPDGSTVFHRPQADADAWLLSLDGEWFQCRVTCKRRIWIFEATKPIVGGMSGSPILTQQGVIGVVNVSGHTECSDDAQHEGGPQAYLPLALPGWMLTDRVPEPTLLNA